MEVNGQEVPSICTNTIRMDIEFSCLGAHPVVVLRVAKSATGQDAGNAIPNGSTTELPPNNNFDTICEVAFGRFLHPYGNAKATTEPSVEGESGGFLQEKSWVSSHIRRHIETKVKKTELISGRIREILDLPPKGKRCYL
ncbi:hypothetical protein RND71_003494 [Anisodus tanguticus]|uniref:Uncharacterized protein n=1 Tax=Anisodus tanguticus TaxID=243964 RepID=A0AAE1VNR6_9SOLA|nr:hypothetical protein RND71_003494 [Anisodus tanguticus]